ncbi:alpha/beta hydrolase family protein [Steroidobacter cummioxidans]|uniref:alpha/beta hydrolase family protein n=1 Tax=Steroidobacter cummioxidans TaxID=1803913 RepID=UPI00137A0F6C|nr:S9 family peptidase [Steroidobacter cummioxidans]
MPRSLAAALSYFCLCIPILTWAAPLPVTAFGQTPAMEFVALSPSGNLLAWLDNRGAQSQLHVFDLTKGAIRTRIGAPPDATVRDLSWFDEETLFVGASMAQRPDVNAPTYEWFRTISVDITSGQSRILLHGAGSMRNVTGSALLSMRTPKPKKVIMSSWDWSATQYKQQTGTRVVGGRKDEGWTYNLYEVDTTSGAPRLIEGGTAFTNAWVVDANGQAIARSEWQADRSSFKLQHRRNGSWSEIFSSDSGELPLVLGMANDGSGVLMRAVLNRPYRAIWRVPFDGSAPQMVISDERSDIGGLIRDPYSQAVTGAWTTGSEPQILWLDDKARSRADGLKKSFGGKQADLLGRSSDNTRALVSVATHATPAIYYLIDYKKGTADIVGEEYPSLVDATLGEVRELTYKARDGYDIPAFVTLPPGADEKQLPLVVLPHGGPESRDMRTFDWLAQFLASRGYVVLQPQFRGSTGYGEAHRRAGYRQWGRLMQDDVTDGVKALIEQGRVDPQRVCIVGASYGGYAALAGAAFTPELYACAVSINGVSNLPLMLSLAEQYAGKQSDLVAYWRDHIGPKTSPEVISKSPSRAADNVRAPVLLLHGVNDSVVPVVQSREMAKALKSLSKPHTLIELPGEDHWLSRSESRTRVLTEMEAFLATHLLAN